jgi:Flp pilus assembly pilin Flp
MHLTTIEPDPERDDTRTAAGPGERDVGSSSRTGHPTGARVEPTRSRHLRVLRDEDGSLVTEYGLLAVVAATIAGVVIQWASGGALVTLFNALLRQARSLVGA